MRPLCPGAGGSEYVPRRALLDFFEFTYLAPASIALKKMAEIPPSLGVEPNCLN